MSDNSIQSKALNRVITQYQDSVKFISMIGSYCSIFQEIKDCHDDMSNRRFIDSAEGAQLDIIGEIVGQVRLNMNKDRIGNSWDVLPRGDEKCGGARSDRTRQPDRLSRVGL